MSERVVLAIPARFAASRLPGKPLRMLAGKPLIAHVIDRARCFANVEMVVATDDPRIASVVTSLGVDVAITRADHATGSDRLAEVVAARGWADDTIVVNLQGDEPLMPVSALSAVVEALRTDTGAAAATLATPVTGVAEAFDPACVKVVCDVSGRALYFSRAPVPWARDAWAKTRDVLPPVPLLRHLGVYAYRALTLRRFATLAQTPLERAESLEQLRLLENGMAIAVRLAPEPIPPGVDTPEDLARVEAELCVQSLPYPSVRKLMFVCLGNICRSPLAEAYARAVFASRGIAVDVCSSGTIGQHEGEQAHRGSIDIARVHGIDLSGHRARQTRAADFGQCDLLLALDQHNLADLRARCPPAHAGKLVRLLDFAPGCGHRDVPDPYGGSTEDFARSFALIRSAVDGLAGRLAGV